MYYGTYPDEKPATATLWIAGHDYCGFDIWRQVRIGTVVALRSSTGDEHRYRIDSRVFVPRQGGTSAGLVHSDLMLQTCKGEGTTITYATRLPH